jgi:type IV pilus assembly protein PilA
MIGMKRDNEDGFTLIELLVVIIIIGILAAIAIPVFLSQKSKGYEASMKSDLRTVAQEMEAYNVDAQNYANVPFKTNPSVPGTSTITAGSGQTVGGSSTVNLSPGNSILLVGADSVHFCLKATTSKATTVPWYYSSNGGGLSKTACS